MTEVSLPIQSVTLFASGVAYIERGGDLPPGESRALLTFRVAQINDILKSLVLMDEGATQPVIYPSRDPVQRTLQTFAVDVSQNQSLADLLKNLRGAEVHILTVGSMAMVGRIVGVESTQETTAQGGYITHDRITLLTDDGLQNLALARVESLRLLDERDERELRDALATLATSRDQQRRTVTLQFSGDAERHARVGYIAESPVWKVSYRLVMEEDAPPYLQGWAIVENTSDEDWENIALSLVSGRPVSFTQDLYEPLYMTRPQIPVDSDGVALPQTHDGDMGGGFGEAVGSTMPEAYAMAAAPAPMMTRSLKAARLESNTTPQATGQAAGELFAYEMSEPVSLPRQQAALIPIVSQRVGGEKLSLYSPQTDARRARNAVRLVNDTDLHLKGGAVTVFDGGTYAGDAQIENVPPGDSRLLTYAVDLGVECEQQNMGGKTASTTVRIRAGVLEITRQTQNTTRYILKSTSAAPKILLIEHPFDSAATLVTPKEPAERTPTVYRFRVGIAPRVTEKLDVTQEWTQGQSVALLTGDVDSLAKFAEGKTLSVSSKRVLTDVLNRRREIGNKRKTIEQLRKEQNDIYPEQTRLRSNMSAVDNDSAIYKRYMDKLDTQETRLEVITEELERLESEVQTTETALTQYLDTLELGE